MRDLQEQQRPYYELSEKYFWLAAQYDIAMIFSEKLISKKKKESGDIKLLDAGCGLGNIVPRLQNWGRVYCADASEEALNYCSTRYGVDVSKMDGSDIYFEDNSFDFIYLLEVIEHVEDDLKMLKELHKILTPGGYLILTAPAYMFLWGFHDEKLGHLRRYTRKELCVLSRNAGFEVAKSSYYKLSFLLPLWVVRKYKRMFKVEQSDFYRISRLMNSIFYLILRIESFVAGLTGLPFGASIILVVHKKPL